MKNRRLTVRVEASALADGVSVLDVLPPATSKGVRPVLPNKERKKIIKQPQAIQVSCLNGSTRKSPHHYVITSMQIYIISLLLV